MISDDGLSKGSKRWDHLVEMMDGESHAGKELGVCALPLLICTGRERSMTMD